MLILSYDLRGIFNKDITPKITKKIIFLFKRKVKKQEIFLSHDLNEKSLIIKEFLLKEFNFLKSLEALPSPLFYFWCLKEKKPGIMITASHLPKDYVGFKFILPNGYPWKPPKLNENKDDSKYLFKKIKPKINNKIYKIYFETLKRKVKSKKKTLVNFNLKNKFLKTALPYFSSLKIIHNKQADFSVSADQDGDRLYFKYKNKNIPLDLIFYFLSLDKKYQKIGVPVYFSKKLEKELKKANKKIYYLPTGHYFFKKGFFKYKLDLAFEPSGHFYFFKDLKTEAPYLALIKFFQMINFEEFLKMLNELKLERFSLKFKNINLEKIVYNLKEKFGFRIKKFDGYLLIKEDCWLHLRKSSTENVLRVTIEGENLKFYKKWLSKK